MCNYIIVICIDIMPVFTIGKERDWKCNAHRTKGSLHFLSSGCRYLSACSRGQEQGNGRMQVVTTSAARGQRIFCWHCTQSALGKSGI